MLEHLIYVNTWYPKYEVELAEQTHYKVFNQKTNNTTSAVQQPKVEQPKKQEQASLSEQIRDVRKTIHNIGSTVTPSIDMTSEQRLTKIETTHQNILQMIDELKRRVEQLEINKQMISGKPAEKVDDDIDLFGSDDEEQNEETKKRLADYAAKKSKKEQIIAKSTIVLDVKPWDDETDLNEMEKSVRSIEADGLIWGPSKFLPVAFGVKKLQIGCVVEDDKIGTDFLEEKICEFEDYVQSVDIVSFNKI
jgi:translation elongation factor EF-1beta